MFKFLIIFYIIINILNFEVLGKIINVILPFILGFVLAYIFNPLLKRLNKKLPKIVSVIIILFLIMLFIILLLRVISPLISREFISLLNWSIYYLNIIERKYNIDLSSILASLYNLLDYKYIIKGITSSLSFITDMILTIISFIYLLVDMDKILCFLKNICSPKIYHLLKNINDNLKQYILSIIKIAIISFFEYSISFLIIKHPNFLLMGIVASISNLIPYIGGVFILLIGILSAPHIIIRVSILYLVMGFIDSYFINSYIFDKYNKIHPLLGLVAMMVFSYIFGIVGFIFATPIIIIIKTIICYYNDDIIKYLQNNHFIR